MNNKKKKHNLRPSIGKLGYLIEKITHSGKSELSKYTLRDIKEELQSNKGKTAEVVSLIMYYLRKDHAEIRRSCVQLCDSLAEDNNEFRSILFDNLGEFMDLSISKKPPPPPLAAKELLTNAIQVFHKWFKKYKEEYMQLELAYHELIMDKGVDFDKLEIVDRKKLAQQQKAEQEELKLNKEHLRITSKEINNMKDRIQESLQILESCLNLIIPSPDNFLEDSGKEVPQNELDNPPDMRLFGVLKYNHNITLDLAIQDKIRVEESEDNKDIFQNAKEQAALIKNKFVPKVKAWFQLLKKVNNDTSEAVDLLTQLEHVLDKFNRIEIISESKSSSGSSDDSDFEEVPQPSTSKKLDTRTPTAPKPQKKSTSSTTDRKQELLKIAPKLPFDVDLYHWEDEKLPTPTIISSNQEGDCFWANNELSSEIPVPGGSSSLRTRVIEFTGEFEPITRTCSAPLADGKLCPRQDRIKCPFHGIIVPRDQHGKILNPEDEHKVSKSKTKPQVPDWQDPKLLAQIKAETGVDLKMPEKGKRKRKHPGLTDVKTESPKTRLSKKIFNKKSLKRVGKTLDKIDQKRINEKFGDQFNYSYHT